MMHRILWLGVLFFLWKSATFVHGKEISPEYTHFPLHFKPEVTKFVNNTDYEVNRYDTPDYRIEEDPLTPWDRNYRHEFERPFRITPYTKQVVRWQKAKFWMRAQPDRIENVGCYCCTVFKRLTPLATCAVITTRHILTTATSTELVLRQYGQNTVLEKILGAWYDIDGDIFNSSMYAAPSRIHYHPKYIFPEGVNASHPIPCVWDLAVWATTYPFMGNWFSPRAQICYRAGCTWLGRGTPTPMKADSRHLMMLVGYQYMWLYKRVPMPWYKYVIKTRKALHICPKTEWGWFFCINSRAVMLGVDSGCALHRSNQRYGYMQDGLLGMAAFSMTLRAKIMTHYFTPLENHPTLDWLYVAYMGRQKYRWLDGRFYDSQWNAPIPKPWYYIPWDYPMGENNQWTTSSNDPLWWR